MMSRVEVGPNAARHPVVAAWLAAQDANLGRGIGLISYQTDAEITAVLGLRSDGLISTNGALVLPVLTEELLSGPQVVDLHRDVAVARHDKRAILAATPLAEAALAGARSSTSNPSELDATDLVARAELAFILEQSCVARVVSNGSAALYLTPIEARLAAALRARGVDFRPQVEIGRFRADFLIAPGPADERLVVECDGAGFHDDVRDAARDRELRELGYTVLRFSGSQIYQDAPACAAAVVSAMRAIDGPSPHSLSVDSSLSARQAEAVSHRDGPARVAAPAGSGKTRVIAARVRQLAACGVDPARICAISFTNKAVDEMRERLPELADRTTFTTLHALAKGIAEAAGSKRTLIQGIRPDRARSIPTRWAVLKPLLDPDEYKFRASNELWVDAVTTYRQSFELPDLEDWDAGNRPAAQRFREVCDEYDRELRDRNLTDFEGWIHDALRALASDPARRDLEAAKFDYWIVDEYQDLPLGKLKLLRLLVAPARNVFVVGDDDQVLYGFAGASPNIFRSFSSEFPGAAQYVLDANFRSPHELVVRTRWLIERNRNRVEKQTRAHQELDGADRVRTEIRSDYDALAESFVRDRLSAGVPPDHIAVLFRLRDMAVPIERRLATAGIPHARCSHERFFERGSVRALLSWLMLVAGPRRDWPALLQDTLRWPPRYLRNETIAALIDEVASDEELTLTDVLTTADAYRDELNTGHQPDALAKYIATVRNASANASPTAILDALALRALMKNEAAGAGQASPVVIYDVLYRLASQFVTVAELIQWVQREGSNSDYDFSSDSEASTPPGAVTLASIHQAKGQEWPHVAVVGPLDGMPDRRAATSGQLEEERRIAYVAATRAQESLLFCASPQYAEELGARADGLTWADYRAGRTTPAPRHATAPGRQARVQRSPRGTSASARGPSGTRATPSRWDDSVPEGASQRKGVWVLRAADTTNGAHVCACGLVAWRPPTGATCPDCDTPL